jgi:hypothetical protein
METAGRHFAEDIEELEGFVLGRLDQAAQARCEEHLRTCESCSQAVLVERIVAAGVKRAGRDQLKDRLRMLTGLPSRRGIPWPRVISIAAVILIIVGFGVSQRWLATHIEPKDVVSAEATQEERKDESVVPQAENEQVAPAPSIGRATPSVQRHLGAEQADAPREPNGKGKAEKPAFAAAQADRLEEPPAMAGGSPGFWTNGTLVTETALKKEASEGRAATTALSGGMNATDADRGKADSFGQVIVEQRPASELPAALQSQQNLKSHQTIQTLVRHVGNETQLTLYPESPFDSTQIHHARVQQVTADSIVVRIGSQLIEYKLPASAMRHTDSSKPGK